MAECTTNALHCAACGKPSDKPQGSIAECHEARVTRQQTCDGNHPTYMVGADPTDAEVDAFVRPVVVRLVETLVMSGRSPATAIADVERSIAAMAAELNETGLFL